MIDDNIVSSTTWREWVTTDMTFANVVVLLGFLGAIGAGVWQGGMIRATLENGIQTERELRIAEASATSGRLRNLETDVREIGREFHQFVMAEGRTRP